jgi:hypothetical protein
MRRLYTRYTNSLNQVALWSDLPVTADKLIDAIDQDLNSVGVGIDIPLKSTKDSAVDFGTIAHRLTVNGWEILVAQMWGHAYVLEGSAMGASMMIKSARSKLPDHAGIEYLKLSTAHAKRRWPRFVSSLQKFSYDLESGSTLSFNRTLEATLDANSKNDSNPIAVLNDSNFWSQSKSETTTDPVQHAISAANDVFAYALHLFDQPGPI